ncbi:DUF2281 domain-containing protein [Roseofilum sp. BLCC_M154]|uniref:DUF2281 domain-containing protein n=1 Tax=Roseofilum acuticapitatum BLCC-M154 TaxID=3022444 RepID=A0ABT7AUK5_9CYAN|nr:DUF2281 domain-containing protein [Roseofilum acuticapitatum]MDJ1170104.1 DUF2281 domain-containing protein [Roseofilum acuticapitatum BLCC-M154]
MPTLETAIKKIQQLPPEQWQKVIEFLEFLEYQSSQQQKTSKTLDNSQVSFAEAAQEFIGCLDSDLEDLSHNPQYLEELGQ